MKTWKNAKPVVATAIMVTLVGVTAGYATPTTAPAVAPAVVEQPDRSATFASYQELVHNFVSASEVATALVTETDGKVLDNTNRDALAAAATELADVVEPASGWLVNYDALDEQAEEDRMYPLFFAQYDTARAQELSEEIATATAAVQADQEAWNAEQERLRLEREAAERAAAAARAEAERVAAAQAVASRPQRSGTASPAGSSSGSSSGSSAAAPASSGVAYTIRSLGAANQSVIDSCSGFGDTTGWLGVPSFSVHWHCGGSRIASLPVGAIVKIENGQYAGTYRFNGLAYRLNGKVNTTADIRVTGGIQIQTCLGGTYSNLGYFTLSRV